MHAKLAQTLERSELSRNHPRVYSTCIGGKGLSFCHARKKFHILKKILLKGKTMYKLFRASADDNWVTLL